MTGPHPSLRVVAGPEEASAAATDDVLFALVQGGDQRAFRKVVARHEAAIRRFATLMIGDADLARDVAQEVFLLAWDQRQRYQPRGRFRVWLLALAKNLTRRERRRRALKRWLGLGLGDGAAPDIIIEGPDGDPGLGLFAAERAAIVQGALGRLPPKMREALVLRYVEELDYEAMAEILGDGASTLRSRVHYGLAKLGRLVPDEVVR